METVLISTKTLSPIMKQFLANTANQSAITSKYLTSYVDDSWHVFTPEQSKAFIQHDNTYQSPYGRYLLMTGTETDDRAIMITERYSLEDLEQQPHQSKVLCFAFALYKPSTQSVLEIYQGESYNETFGWKVWDTRSMNSDWKTIQILAKPRYSNSVDIFFYIVSIHLFYKF